MNIKTKLTSHSKYYSKLLLNKKYWQELGFKDNDNVKITKLENGKVIIESLGQAEKENIVDRTESLDIDYPSDVNFLETVKLLKVVEKIGDDENV